MRLDKNRSQLLVIDIQDRLAPVIDGCDAIVKQAGILMRAARRLDVPIRVTEQYPAGLGNTVSTLAEYYQQSEVFTKTSFSALDDRQFREYLAAGRRDQLVICGTEAHVCVLQTALQALDLGYRAVMVSDAVGSRQHVSKSVALGRFRDAGGVEVTTEMVVFEWLRQAGTDAFRDLHPLIK